MSYSRGIIPYLHVLSEPVHILAGSQAQGISKPFISDLVRTRANQPFGRKGMDHSRDNRAVGSGCRLVYSKRPDDTNDT